MEHIWLGEGETRTARVNFLNKIVTVCAAYFIISRW